MNSLTRINELMAKNLLAMRMVTRDDSDTWDQRLTAYRKCREAILAQGRDGLLLCSYQDITLADTWTFTIDRLDDVDVMIVEEYYKQTGMLVPQYVFDNLVRASP
jgi:hypothetical protein